MGLDLLEILDFCQYSHPSFNTGILFAEKTVFRETVLEEVYSFKGGWWSPRVGFVPLECVERQHNPWISKTTPCSASVSKHKPWISKTVFREAVLEEG